MKDNQNERNMGEQIMEALSDALQGGDFSDLNRLVSQSVNNVINEVGRQAQEQVRRQTQKQTRQQEKAEREERARRQAQQMYQQRAGNTGRQNASFQNMPQTSSWQTAPAVPLQPDHNTLLPSQFKRVGNVSNVLYQVFGGIGLGFTLLITFLHLSTVVLEGTVSISGWIINLLFIALFTGMIRLGIGQRRRLKLAERYAKLCGRNLYGEIEHLAGSTGRKTRHVIRDLQRMMKIGMFPEGHLDEKKTCFMLNDNIYKQYLETETNRRIREAESQKLSSPQAVQNVDVPKTDSRQAQECSEQEAELNAMIAEGMECIRKLRALNDQIPGEVISAKLSRLENLLKDLFDSVREHPEQMHRMHKLMDYYLPTTLKLVEAYEEFDRVSVPGDDIIAAKAEIENTLDTINQAFTELLNNLFQDAVLDVTTDAQVLKTMLAREGLMNEMDMHNKQNVNGGN